MKLAWWSIGSGPRSPGIRSPLPGDCRAACCQPRRHDPDDVREGSRHLAQRVSLRRRRRLDRCTCGDFPWRGRARSTGFGTSASCLQRRRVAIRPGAMVSRERSGDAGASGVSGAARPGVRSDPLLVVPLLSDVLRTAARRRSRLAGADRRGRSGHPSSGPRTSSFAKPAGYLFLTPEEQALVSLHCSASPSRLRPSLASGSTRCRRRPSPTARSSNRSA